MMKKLEKLLHIFGIERYTNRRALMEELEALSDEEFERALDGSPLGEMLNRTSCAECRYLCGHCQRHGDAYCGEFDLPAWLRRDWCSLRIIDREAIHNG